MSGYQKTLCTVLFMVLYYTYATLVQDGVITSVVLSSQWITIGSYMFIPMFAACALGALIIVLSCDTKDKQAIEIFNDIHGVYPNSNPIRTGTCYIFVPIIIGLIQLELYIIMLFAIVLAISFYAFHKRYQSVLERAKYVELVEEAKKPTKQDDQHELL